MAAASTYAIAVNFAPSYRNPIDATHESAVGLHSPGDDLKMTAKDAEDKHRDVEHRKELA